ncbi:MAG: hypothetical protein IMY69_08870 [Bacteroidetes bacterium]|nr:hypothetical protein [Bacteroidota bacterium]
MGKQNYTLINQISNANNPDASDIDKQDITPQHQLTFDNKLVTNPDYPNIAFSNDSTLTNGNYFNYHSLQSGNNYRTLIITRLTDSTKQQIKKMEDELGRAICKMAYVNNFGLYIFSDPSFIDIASGNNNQSMEIAISNLFNMFPSSGILQSGINTDITGILVSIIQKDKIDIPEIIPGMEINDFQDLLNVDNVNHILPNLNNIVINHGNIIYYK